jgi:hypothetical protein
VQNLALLLVPGGGSRAGPLWSGQREATRPVGVSVQTLVLVFLPSAGADLASSKTCI